MKKQLYLLALVILFSNSLYSSDAAEPSLREEIAQIKQHILFTGIAIVLGISLLAYRNKSSLVKWFKSLLYYVDSKKTKINSCGSDDSSDEEFDFSERGEGCSTLEKRIEKMRKQKKDRVTPLHIACHKNDTNEVRSLLLNLD